jgi:hypothetical protein
LIGCENDGFYPYTHYYHILRSAKKHVGLFGYKKLGRKIIVPREI